MPRAFIWQGNPDRWTGSGTMETYLADKSQYVYWSTPQCRNHIQLGDRAFIWRTQGNEPRGIIAAGTVAELPCENLPPNYFQFKHPNRLPVGEEAASSIWKTGISISEVRFRFETGMVTAEMLEAICPDLPILRMPRFTVYRLDVGQCNKIDTLWANPTQSRPYLAG